MTQQRYEREKKMLADFPEGTIVRVRDPDGYIAAVASKIRDRLGEVTGHQIPTPNLIVTFHAIGRKIRHQMVFRFQPERDLEIVTDEQEIAAWRAAVEVKKVSMDRVRKLRTKTP